MTNYFTHPGQHATTTIQGQQYVDHDWQGNARFTCCRGRAACGRHVNYTPKVEQCARIANGPAVWQVESVDERERLVTLWTVRDNGETDRRVIGFENLTIVSPAEYARDMGAANIRRSQLGEPSCPDTCPDCGADLKSDGYPIGHQDDETGDPCPFTWARLG